jgi:ADP-ribose pyrophosphatase
VTAPRSTLPEAPKVELETISETLHGEGGFLVLRRTELVTITMGARSAGFAYDAVHRRALDASVMVAHHEHEGRVCVWLRSSLRPPVALRHDAQEAPGAPSAPPPLSPVLWEVPAGLIEPGETPRAAAAREIAEELGFDVAEEAMLPLGPPSHPAPAFIAELHHFFHVEVEPTARREPAGDGTPVEAGAIVVCVPLDEALAACRRGHIRDEKTELALRRLADELGAR